MFKPNRNQILIGIAVLAIIVTGLLVFANSSSNNVLSFLKGGMSADAIAKKSVDYLNKNVLPAGQTAALVNFSEESGVVKFKIKIADKTYDSYATRDGKLLFPEAFTVDTKDAKAGSQTGQTGQNQDNQPSGQAVDIVKVKVAGEPSVGNQSAKVTIAEWSDYQCPFCKKFVQEVMPKLFTDYIKTGKVKLVYKDYQFLGSDSQTAGLAARAVWETAPSKFYDWHEAMYQKQDSENSGWGNKADILALTKSLGIDSDKVGKLMTSKAEEYQKAMDADKTEGASLGINGTPAFVISKQLISGFTSYESLKEIIDKILNGK